VVFGRSHGGLAAADGGLVRVGGVSRAQAVIPAGMAVQQAGGLIFTPPLRSPAIHAPGSQAAAVLKGSKPRRSIIFPRRSPLLAFSW
jgi:hypothetical protein